MKLNNYFDREEFACHCGCGFATVDVELLAVLTQVRWHFKQPLTIHSGCRCDAHNQAVGGKPNSKHKQGIAADIVVRTIAPYVVHDYLESLYPDSYGLGRYISFTHIDIRPDKQRWEGVP